MTLTRYGNLSIHPLLRYRAPYTAPRIFHVAGVAGDNVEVHHRLAGGCSHVRAVGVEPSVEEGFCLPGEEGGLLGVGRVEEAGDVPVGVFRSELCLGR